MGLPSSGAVRDSGPRAEDGGMPLQQFLDAPLRLEAESYASFTRRLMQHSGTSGAPEVEEELRRLQIDPEIFYRGAQQLGLREYSADEAVTATSSGPSPSLAGFAAAFAEASGAVTDGNGADEFRPPPRASACDSLQVGGSWAEQVSTPSRAAAAAREALGFEDEDEPSKGMPQLNVPYNDFEEEICLEGAGETFGGRMGRETPRELEAKLQIDSLTDDEDDSFVGSSESRRKEPTKPPDEEEPIEAFELDPDFDYENTKNLTRRV